MIGRVWNAVLKASPLRFWVQAGAGVALTVVFCAYGLAIRRGPWPDRVAEKQIEALSQGQLVAGFLVLVALVCITGQKVNFNASKQGITADIGDDDEPQKFAVTGEVTATPEPK
jgi:hypothetical protein